jgi:hypothetical protein
LRPRLAVRRSSSWLLLIFDGNAAGHAVAALVCLQLPSLVASSWALRMGAARPREANYDVPAIRAQSGTIRSRPDVTGLHLNAGRVTWEEIILGKRPNALPEPWLSALVD